VLGEALWLGFTSSRNIKQLESFRSVLLASLAFLGQIKIWLFRGFNFVGFIVEVQWNFRHLNRLVYLGEETDTCGDDPPNRRLHSSPIPMKDGGRVRYLGVTWEDNRCRIIFVNTVFWRENKWREIAD
jgi:hypothetical protein